MKKKNLWKYLICIYASFLIGYFVRSIHYRQDLPRIQKAQQEIRLEFKIIEQKKELAELIDRLLWEYEEIIEMNERNEKGK